MSVTTLLSIVEFFTELLYNAAKRHTTKAADLSDRINILKGERDDNLNEAKRAKAVADKIADFIS